MPLLDYLPVRDDNATIPPGDIRVDEPKLQQLVNAIRQLMMDLAEIFNVDPVVINGGLIVTGQNVFTGDIFGLTLSNNVTDAVNDIDIAAGYARALADDWSIVLASGLTKRLDAAWAVGTNQGGLDTGAIADVTYHVWLIRRPDTGVVDALFSASATAPTMPTNYTQKRRIGSILREAAAIVGFRQYGDVFKRIAATDRSSTAAATNILLALSVPIGIKVSPFFALRVSGGISVTCALRIGDGDVATTEADAAIVNTAAADGFDETRNIIGGIFFTNTAGEIRFTQSNNVGTPSSSTFTTFGWIDTRGY